MTGTPMAAAEMLGVELVSDRLDSAGSTDAADEVVCRLRIGESHLNQGLIGHGGVLFTLADTAVGLLANAPDLGRAGSARRSTCSCCAAPGWATSSSPPPGGRAAPAGCRRARHG